MIKLGLRWQLLNKTRREKLNNEYITLGPAEWKRWHRKYSHVLKTRPDIWGVWCVYFLGTRILMPMKRWEQCLTILGYDQEITQYYAAMLTQEKITDFIDVGANYGNHSWLFASQGVNVVAIEPNSQCIKAMREVMFLNGYALAAPSQVALVAPENQDKVYSVYCLENQPWLGIVGETREAAFLSKAASDRSPKIQDSMNLRVGRCSTTTLDSLSENYNIRPKGGCIVKIDVEGHETEVLLGSRAFIQTFQPHIVFESFEVPEFRERLFNILHNCGYHVLSRLHPAGHPIKEREFLASGNTNFLAVPK